MSVTLQQVKDRVPTDLADSVLQLIIDSETEALTRQHGSAAVVETQQARGLKQLVLRRRPASITSVTERVHLTDDPVTLAANDYRQIGNRLLLRLGDGANPADYWGTEVVVTYTADVDNNLRDRVLLDLCQLAIEFRAYEREVAGDWEGWQDDYDERRAAILRQVREPSLPLV